MIASAMAAQVELQKALARETGNNANIPYERADLVFMPLCEILAMSSLSWAQRRIAADALRQSIRQWNSMEVERHMLQQREACTSEQKVAG